MNKQTQALKLALEALDCIYSPLHVREINKVGAAMAAIREALAEQPAQQYCKLCGDSFSNFNLEGAVCGDCAHGIEKPVLAEQPAQQECNHCGGTGDVSGEYPGVACPECSGSGVQAQPEFIKHEVENAYDWSEWVCPDPESYLMKCCDCGLVHEAQFRVAKYKPAPSDECEVVSDPDLQAQFRMRRSEQWSPEDTAHRAGGLPMAEQPAPCSHITNEQKIANGLAWLERLEALRKECEALAEQPAQQQYQSTADKCELTPVPAKGGLLPAQQQEPVSAIRALTDQCAALIQERDELQKQVWRYEKNGVTCQTYRHKIDRTYSECNVQEDYTSPQPAQQQEPVAWLSRDDARLALWDAINKREFGNPTDDKLILDHLRKNGLWIGKYTSPPASKLLTDEQWQSIADTLGCIITRGQKDIIEAVLDIKENT